MNDNQEAVNAAWNAYEQQHEGVLSDQQRRTYNIERVGENGLCDRCEGTGNQFLFKYQQCEACKGTGRKEV